MLTLFIVLITITISTILAWKIWAFIEPENDKSSTPTIFITRQLKYQFVLLVIAILTLFVSYFLSGKVLGFGQIDDVFSTNGILKSLDNQISWLFIGTLFLLIIAAVTYVMVKNEIETIKHKYQFINLHGVNIISISALNAFSEELIYRGALISAMTNFSGWHIVGLSALVFSLAHIHGQVNGVFVLIGSGFVGGILAFSVIQTNGLFWAWVIHFVQDILIFTAFVANMANKKIKRDCATAQPLI